MIWWQVILLLAGIIPVGRDHADFHPAVTVKPTSLVTCKSGCHYSEDRYSLTLLGCRVQSDASRDTLKRGLCCSPHAPCNGLWIEEDNFAAGGSQFTKSATDRMHLRMDATASVCDSAWVTRALFDSFSL